MSNLQNKKHSRVKFALRAARRGWAVIPLQWIENGHCSCSSPRCAGPGKHPLTTHGVKDATTDEATIRKWWKEHPKANVGVATGRPSGFVTLDIDLRHGGFKSLDGMEKRYGALPDGPQVRTGGGGLHLYFLYPSVHLRNKPNLMPGVDLIADGGYVVAPGSTHESDEEYLWKHNKTPEKMPIPFLPDWLLQLAGLQRSPQPQAESTIREGARNSTLASLAGTMRSRGMTPQAIEAALLEENRLRCDPSLPDSEVQNIAASISRYTPGDFLSARSTNEEEKERKVRFRTGAEIAAETPANIPWLARPWVVFGAITEVDGKVKLAGKTTLVTHMVRAVLDELPFLGEPTARTNAVYLTEQPSISFRAAMERAGLLGRRDFIVLFWADTIGVPWASVVGAAVRECKRRGAKLLVVDTLPQFAGLVGDSENNAGDALKALRPLQKAATEKLAIVIVRHERKSGGTVGDSGRGSSAYAGVVDIVLSLRRPEGNQARNIRLLQTVSRFEAPDELLIELTDDGYRSLGAPGEVAREHVKAELLAAIPDTRRRAITIEALAKETKKNRPHIQRVLDELSKEGKILRIGKGRKGDPYRYSTR